MNKLTIERQNGNIPASLPGEDHVSGIIFYLPTAQIPPRFRAAVVPEDLAINENSELIIKGPTVVYPSSKVNMPDTFVNSPIQAVSTIDKAEELGITHDSEYWNIRLIYYHLNEIFRMNPAISLFVGIYAQPETNTFNEICEMQHYANGRIRQMAIWNGAVALAASDLTKIQAKANSLDEDNAPLSVLYAAKVANHAALPQNLATGCERVSVVIAQAGIDPLNKDDIEMGAGLYSSNQNTGKATVSCVGLALGMLSRAGVHQSISWAKMFPSGISVPALGDGKLVRNIDKAVLEQLDAARYLFLTPIVGVVGSYWNDSHNMTDPTGDYNAIERVRTMDKAVRGIRIYLAPELGGNVYIDPETGKMQNYTVSHLETVANKALEDMEKAGELSGYKAVIDPNQDVLSTSTVEVVIKNVPVGVMRRIKVKIGFVKQL